MKKKAFFGFITGVLFVLVLAIPASACHFENIVLEADCYGYSISGEIWSAWQYHAGAHIVYSLSANGEAVSGDVEIVIDSDIFEGFPFEISGSWGQEFCGEVEVEGTVEWWRLYLDDILWDSVTIALPPLDCPCYDWCPRTPGFWKNHPEAWPVDELTIGGVVYAQEELLALLDAPVGGNKTLILVKHLIAAMLNGLAGSDVSGIADAINAADACLANGDCDWEEAEPLKDILDEFNNSEECD